MHPLPAPQNPFRSFWMAGFECADHLNAFGERVDFLEITGHLAHLNEDYDNLQPLNIRTVREGIRWSEVERIPNHYRWQAVERMIDAGSKQNIQQIWDLCHFGYPDDLTPLHPKFSGRFARLCKAFVRFYRSIDTVNPLIVTPINEASFLSWLGGDARGTSPYCTAQGREVKYALMRAYIEGIAAMKEEDPGVRILTTEPLVNVTTSPLATRVEKRKARVSHECQFQVIDMLSGVICPELGGTSDYLDLLGFNFYYNNQWVPEPHETLDWKQLPPDPRWKSLSRLIHDAFSRYQRPIVLSETSHPKEDRPFWIQMIGHECEKLLKEGIPLWGVCWYPIVDRPDWDHLDNWHHAGLWDHDPSRQCKFQRIPHQPTLHAFRQTQERLDRYLNPTESLL